MKMNVTVNEFRILGRRQESLHTNTISEVCVPRVHFPCFLTSLCPKEKFSLSIDILVYQPISWYFLIILSVHCIFFIENAEAVGVVRHAYNSSTLES